MPTFWSAMRNVREIARRAAMQPDGWSDGPRAVRADEADDPQRSDRISSARRNTLRVRTGTWVPTGRLPYEKLLQAGEGRGKYRLFEVAAARSPDHAHYGPGIGTMLPFD
jgi:hypothetical protein